MARLILRLDARSLRVLAALYLHPLLSTPQLAVVFGVQLTSAERMLRRLRRLDLVQMQACSGVQRCVLSDPGVRLLTRCAHLAGGAHAVQTSSYPPRVLRRYQREIRALARTPEHTEGVYSFFTALFQSCAQERARGHDATLLWWETGNVCARAFRDAGGWRTIRPDGAGEWRVEGKCFRFWLEWDRGTMGLRDLRAKFTAYARYVSSLDWRAEGSPTTPLPVLLVITPSLEQEALVEQALRATFPPSVPFAVYLTTESSLLAHRQGPLAPIWRPFGGRTTPLVQFSSPLTLSDSRV
jgi:hypothetical protein